MPKKLDTATATAAEAGDDVPPTATAAEAGDDVPHTADAANAGDDVPARVLTDCHYGRTDAVVELPPDIAALGVEAGVLDINRDAVAYARSLAAAAQ